ncbi:hypothetical protein HDV06_002803 [Boothiomyces sp. JEL0866]|nr:hypothetical protein HDV06_002803 [Boothiomyces sp. JEL0866]
MLLASILAALVTALDLGGSGLSANNPYTESIAYIPGRHSMIQPITVHIIWYGQNWKPTQKQLLLGFLDGLDQSEFWKIAHMYYNTDANGHHKEYVTSTVKVGTQVNDPGSFGNYLNNITNLQLNPTTARANDIPYIIYNFIKKGKLPVDLNAIYMLISDDQTNEGTACDGYCGYHTSILSDQLAVAAGPVNGELGQQNWNPNTQFCGPTYPSLSPKSECKAIQKMFPQASLGNDCCSSGYADCANGHVVGVPWSSNDLNGTVESYITFITSNFPEISEIVLSDNNLVGPIPKSICSLTNLVELYLQGNVGINGTLPSCIGKMTNLQRLRLGGTSVTGPIPDSLPSLGNLRYLDLSSTLLSGKLPPGFGAMKKLNFLALTNTTGLAGHFQSGLVGFNGQSLQSIDQVICDASLTGLCLPKYYSGPICGLSPCQ